MRKAIEGTMPNGVRLQTEVFEEPGPIPSTCTKYWTIRSTKTPATDDNRWSV
ncbi:hypothetical protein M9458_031213 [Cirrhinus mrigala]|uniref:Uncharacterized protein n=1 Tax=Cirrhinus mrigala TaxID=683832 RepID=A0ABD0PMI6_CIRMR